MSKKRSHRGRQQSHEPGPARRRSQSAVAEAAEVLTRAAEEFVKVLAVNPEELETLLLPPILADVAQVVESGQLRIEADCLTQAWHVIATDTPIAAVAPPPYLEGRGQRQRWKGPLDPHELLHHASFAKPGDPGYRTQLRETAAYHARRAAVQAEQLEQQCGYVKETDGKPCRVIPIYMPPSGFASGYHCWRHVTADETEVALRIYEAVWFHG